MSKLKIYYFKEDININFEEYRESYIDIDEQNHDILVIFLTTFTTEDCTTDVSKSFLEAATPLIMGWGPTRVWTCSCPDH